MHNLEKAEQLEMEMEHPKNFAKQKIREKIFENYFVWVEDFMHEHKIIEKDQMLMTNKKLARNKRWKEK